MNIVEKAAGYLIAAAGYARSRLFAVSLLSVITAIFVFMAADTANKSSVAGLRPGEYSASGGKNVAAALAYDGDTDSLADKLDTDEENAPPPQIRAASFYAYAKVDGETYRLMGFKSNTVKELLERGEIELGLYDKVDYPLDETVEQGAVITVTRINYVTIKRREIVPYSTVITYSPKLEPGTAKVLSPGENGGRTVTVRKMLVDGEVTEETEIENVVDMEPIPQREIRGFSVKPVSEYDFNFDFDENCEPVGYENVMRSQKSAGYSARAGAGTASGLKAVVGHVAVNPKVIPYGTKLFIKSSDGKHIYGYAIAADTGTALMQGVITVDLLYATYKESAANGIRNVDIFILETPD